MGNDWKRSAYLVHMMNLPHAPAGADVKKSRKTHSENGRNQNRQKRPDENHDTNHTNQELQLESTKRWQRHCVSPRTQDNAAASVRFFDFVIAF
jgi:IS5 family transposase